MPAPLPKPAIPPVKNDSMNQSAGAPTVMPPAQILAPGAPTPTKSSMPTAPTGAPFTPQKPAAPVASNPMSAPKSTPSIPVNPSRPVTSPAPANQQMQANVSKPMNSTAAPQAQKPLENVGVQQSNTPAAPVLASIPKPPQAIPQQPMRIQQPPQTLTALSSMASNRLPASGAPTPAPISDKPSSGGLNATKTPQVPKSPGNPQIVQPKKSIFRFLPFIGGGILLLLILGFVAFRFLGLGGSGTTSVSNTTNPNSNTNGQTGATATGPKVTLEYWGLWEPTETMATVIKDYESKNSNVTIKYNKQSHQDYRVRLQNALNSENGPDLFRYHASWVPMLRQQLAALPTSIMTPTDFQTTFYPAAVNQLQSNGQLVGIPLMYDGLVLYYNTELFETAVVEPPSTWSDLRTVANQLKLKSGNTITRGGIAMGNATNVEHFSDILAVLILQNNGDFTKPNSPEVRDALLFYTNFMKTDEVWSETLPSSTVAFARGDVAMMLAPSWRSHEIKAMNPELKFATTPLPQLSDTRVTWATYWAEGVNTKSTKKDESWKFLKYLSSKEVQQKLYSDQAKTRGFGELYSRKDLANELANDPITSAFMQDAPFAKGWQMSSYTHDDGANDQIIKYYEDAVTALLAGKQIEEVQGTLNQGVTQVLRQYGISSATAQ